MPALKYLLKKRQRGPERSKQGRGDGVENGVNDNSQREVGCHVLLVRLVADANASEALAPQAFTATLQAVGKNCIGLVMACLGAQGFAQFQHQNGCDDGESQLCQHGADGCRTCLVKTLGCGCHGSAPWNIKNLLMLRSINR